MHMKSLNSRLFTKRAHSPAWRVAVAFVGLLDAILTLIVSPFGWGCNLHYNFIMYMTRREADAVQALSRKG